MEAMRKTVSMKDNNKVKRKKNGKIERHEKAKEISLFKRIMIILFILS